MSYHEDQSFDERPSHVACRVATKAGYRAGDALTAKIEAGRIVLIPQKKRPHKIKIVKDPITGFPVLSAGPNAPILTSKEVREILADFP